MDYKKSVGKASFFLITASFITLGLTLAIPVFSANIQKNPNDTSTSVTYTGGGVHEVRPVKIDNTNYAVSKWDYFRLDNGETAKMIFPEGVKNYINRMVSGNPLEIYGKLYGILPSGKIGGNLIFISPAGITIGSNAVLAASSILMTTASSVKIGTFDINSADIDPLNPPGDIFDPANTVTFDLTSNNGITNHGKIFTVNPTLSPIDEFRQISLVSQFINNSGVIGEDPSVTFSDTSVDTEMYNYKTDKVNLVTGSRVELQDGVYTPTLASNIEKGFVNIYKNNTNTLSPQIRANQINISTYATNPAIEAGAAINVDGLVQAYAVESNNGQISLQVKSDTAANDASKSIRIGSSNYFPNSAYTSLNAGDEGIINISGSGDLRIVGTYNSTLNNIPTLTALIGNININSGGLLEIKDIKAKANSITIDSSGDLTYFKNGTYSFKPSLLADNIYLHSDDYLNLNNVDIGYGTGTPTTNIGISANNNISLDYTVLKAQNLGIGSTQGSITLSNSPISEINNIFLNASTINLYSSISFINELHAAFNDLVMDNNVYIQGGTSATALVLGSLPNDTINTTFAGSTFADAFGDSTTNQLTGNTKITMNSANNNISLQNSASGTVAIKSKTGDLTVDASGITGSPGPSISGHNISISSATGSTTLKDVKVEATGNPERVITIDAKNDINMTGTSNTTKMQVVANTKLDGTEPDDTTSGIYMAAGGNVNLSTAYIDSGENIGIKGANITLSNGDSYAYSKISASNIALIADNLITMNLTAGSTPSILTDNLFASAYEVRLGATTLALAKNSAYLNLNKLTLNDSATLNNDSTGIHNIDIGYIPNFSSKIPTSFSGNFGSSYSSLLDRKGDLTLTLSTISKITSDEGSINIKAINVDSTNPGNILITNSGNGPSLSAASTYISTPGSVNINNVRIATKNYISPATAISNNIAIAGDNGITLNGTADLRAISKTASGTGGNLALISQNGDITINSTSNLITNDNLYVYTGGTFDVYKDITSGGNMYLSFADLKLNNSSKLSLLEASSNKSINIGIIPTSGGDSINSKFTGSNFSSDYGSLTAREGSTIIELGVGVGGAGTSDSGIYGSLTDGTGAVNIKSQGALTLTAPYDLDQRIQGNKVDITAAGDIETSKIGIKAINNLTMSAIPNTGTGNINIGIGTSLIAQNMGLGTNNGSITLASDIHDISLPTETPDGELNLYTYSGELNINRSLSADNMYLQFNTLNLPTTLTATSGNINLGAVNDSVSNLSTVFSGSTFANNFGSTHPTGDVNVRLTGGTGQQLVHNTTGKRININGNSNVNLAVNPDSSTPVDRTLQDITGTASGSFNINSNDNLTLNGTSISGNTINIDSKGTTSLNAGNSLQSTSSTSISSDGNLNVSSATVGGGNIDITSKGTTTLGSGANIQSSDTFSLDSTGNLAINGSQISGVDIYMNSAGTTTIGTSTTLTADRELGSTVDPLRGNLGLSGDTGLTISSQNLSADRDIALVSQNNNINVNQSVTAGNNLYLYATGNVNLAGDVSLQANKAIYAAFKNLSLGNNSHLKSLDGDLIIQSSIASLADDFSTWTEANTKIANLASINSDITIDLSSGSNSISATGGDLSITSPRGLSITGISSTGSSLEGTGIHITSNGTLTVSDLSTNAGANGLSITENPDIVASPYGLTITNVRTGTIAPTGISIESAKNVTIENSTLHSSDRIRISGNNDVEIKTGSNLQSSGDMGIASTTGNISVNNSTVTSGVNLYTKSNGLTITDSPVSASSSIYTMFNTLGMSGTGTLDSDDTIHIGHLPSTSPFSSMMGIGTHSGNLTINLLSGGEAITAANGINVANSGLVTINGTGDTTIRRLIANITNNNLSIQSTGSLNLENFRTSSNINGNINISSSGDLSLGGATRTIGANNINLESTTAGVTVGNASLTTSAGRVRAAGATGVSLSGSSLDSGNVGLLTNTGDVSLTNSQVSADGAVYVYGSNVNLTGSSVGTTSGKAHIAFDSLTADSSSTINSNSDLNLGNIPSTAVSEDNALANEFRAKTVKTGNNISLAGGTPLKSTAGRVNIHSSGNLSLTASTASAIEGGGVDIITSGTGTNNVQNIQISSGTGNTNIAANSGSLTLAGTTITGSNININSGGTTTLNSGTSLTANGSSSANNGNLRVSGTTEVSISGSSLDSTNNTGILSGSGDVSLTNSSITPDVNVYIYGNTVSLINSSINTGNKGYIGYNSLNINDNLSSITSNGNLQLGNIPDSAVSEDNVLANAFKSYTAKSGNGISLAGSTPLQSTTGKVNLRSRENLALTGSTASAIQGVGIDVTAGGTGSNNIQHIQFSSGTGNLNITANSGALTLDNVAITNANNSNIISKNNLGFINTVNLASTGDLYIRSTDGNLSLDNTSTIINAGNIYIRANLGSITIANANYTSNNNTIIGGNSDVTINGSISGTKNTAIISRGNNLQLNNGTITAGNNLYTYGKNTTVSQNSTLTGNKMVMGFDSLTNSGTIRTPASTDNIYLAKNVDTATISNDFSGSPIAISGFTSSTTPVITNSTTGTVSPQAGTGSISIGNLNATKITINGQDYTVKTTFTDATKPAGMNASADKIALILPNPTPAPTPPPIPPQNNTNSPEQLVASITPNPGSTGGISETSSLSGAGDTSGVGNIGSTGSTSGTGGTIGTGDTGGTGSISQNSVVDEGIDSQDNNPLIPDDNSIGDSPDSNTLANNTDNNTNTTINTGSTSETTETSENTQNGSEQSTAATTGESNTTASNNSSSEGSQSESNSNKSDNKDKNENKNKDKNEKDKDTTSTNDNQRKPKTETANSSQTIFGVSKKEINNSYGELFINSLITNNSKENEFIADQSGFEGLKKAGYHPAGLEGFLMTLEQLETLARVNRIKEPVNNSFTYRHPPTDRRITVLDNDLNSLRKDGSQFPSTISRARFNRIMSTMSR